MGFIISRDEYNLQRYLKLYILLRTENADYKDFSKI